MLTGNGKGLLVINDSNTRPTSGRWHRNTGDYDNFSSGSSVNIMIQRLALHVGTGTSAPDVSNIGLTNRGAGLTVINRTGTNVSQSIEPTADRIGVFTVTYKNNTESDITVTEVGLCSDVDSWYVLFARELLETPVTIAPGEAYTFTMYIG